MANLASSLASARNQLIARFAPSVANSSFIPTTVISNKDIGPGPKLVYSRLLAYASVNESPTNDTLAADLAISPRSVRNYIAALKAAGLLEVHLRGGKFRTFRLTPAQ